MALASIKVLGVDIRLDASWIILALLIAWSLAVGAFPILYSGLPAFSYWGMAAAVVVGVAASIVLHELGHAFAARLSGVRTKSITLFVFGGVANIESEPKTARAELFMALVGPAVSAAIAIALLVASGNWQTRLSAEAYGVLHYLGMFNMMLAIFNMAPAFPLDGGRVLRAVLWLRSGDRAQATLTATGVGEVIAWAMMGFGMLAALTGGLVGGLWWLILGFQILLLARAYRVEAEANIYLSGLRVSGVMTPDPVTAPADIVVERFVEDYLMRHPHEIIPVVENDAVVGYAGLAQVRQLPRESWARTRLSEIAAPLSMIAIAEPQTEVVDALERMQRTGAGRLLVIANGRLAGILTLKDVLAHLSFRADLSALRR